MFSKKNVFQSYYCLYVSMYQRLFVSSYSFMFLCECLVFMILRCCEWLHLIVCINYYGSFSYTNPWVCEIKITYLSWKWKLFSIFLTHTSTAHWATFQTPFGKESGYNWERDFFFKLIDLFWGVEPCMDLAEMLVLKNEVHKIYLFLPLLLPPEITAQSFSQELDITHKLV